MTVPAEQAGLENMDFERMWRELSPIGRCAGSGGYFRTPFDGAERECMQWYAEESARRDLTIEYDGVGNAVAWWCPDTASGPGVVTGSHLDSVLDGGAFDGPLGVVSGFAAIDVLRERGFTPTRPIGVSVFVGEEGSRFGIACLGSRLATGTLDPDLAAQLRDRDGVSLLEAMRTAGLEPELGPSGLIERIGTFVELHVEQGRELAVHDRSVGVASRIWPHGRYRFDFDGQANHAGTTRMEDRHDPMLTYAMTALAANKQARLSQGAARATFGRLSVEPGATNAVPSRVSAWLDARCENDEVLEALLATITRMAAERAGRDGTSVTLTRESASAAVSFDEGLAARVAGLLDGAPIIATQAGHDAGILAAAGVRSAMLFVRNPTGVSHSPQEYAETSDCLDGVLALADVLEELAR